MTVIIDGREYSAETATGLINEIKGMHWQAGAETATGLINEIKGMHWQAGADTTPEEYIAMQERTYRKMMRRRMKLPKGDTETRAKAMFKAVADTGAWIYKEG